MFRKLLLTTALCATLAACEGSEERAERHYQSALQLIAEGEVERALVELRNVFDFNGLHREARQLYAATVLEQGRLQEAYSQYLRLVEQYPQALEARLTLADLSMRSGNWEEVARHGGAAMELAPDDPRSRAVAAAIAYREAVTGEDPAAKAEAAAAARAVLEETSDSQIARRIVIDDLATGPDPAAALPEIERALQVEPEALDLQFAKLKILADADPQDPAVGAQLERMLELFPENEDVQQTLLSWYMSQGDLGGAEALLRRFAETGPNRRAGNALVIRFLSETGGPQAAQAELERLVAAEDTSEADRVFYRTMLAGLAFDAGARDRAIADMQAMLRDATASEETRQAKTVLARMLLETGNPVGARALVEEVLEVDESNVAALKMRAAWAIEDDRPLDALSDLNTALSQAPQDPQTILLMADAYERDGNLELTGERLALAAETAGYDPAYAMPYARFLLSQGRIDAARSVLNEARRARPGTPEVLDLAGRLALQEEDPTALTNVLAELDRAAQGPAPGNAAAVAMALRTGQMLAAGQVEETAEMLEAEAARGGPEGARAAAMLAVTRFQQGDPEAARAAVEQALEEMPGNPELIVMSADLHLASGDVTAAKEVLRQALQEAPGDVRLTIRLYEVLAGTGDTEAARAVLEAGLEAAPDAPQLKLLEAFDLERAGDYQGAIAVYEELYERDESNLVVANNLASLLATYDDSPEALERAESIGRRLRARPVPAFQDTWGWIAYRLGNFDEALRSLEPAAIGLPEDPMVQYHLGKTYLALGRPGPARNALTRAVTIAGETDSRPQIADARALLEDLASEADPAVASETDPEADPEAAPDAAPETPSGDAAETPAETPAEAPPAETAPAE